jgi:GTP-binding protein HflX
MKNSGMARRQAAFLVGLQTVPGRGPAAASERGTPVAGIVPEPAEWGVEQCLDELARLADSAGLRVVGRTWQRRAQPDPRTYLGAGKLAAVGVAAREAGASVVLFDDELTPSQLRSVEQSLGEELLTVDRTALILDIFARHARSREGQLQVELAQLEYRLPRLTRLWTHLARQAGGRAGAGVGLRGPGETQIEVDRRRIRHRLGVLRTRIRTLARRRRDGRDRRHHSGSPVLALVGYTNAGKSTLMNRLTGAGVYAANQLFATLDPTTRQVDLGAGRRALLTDTVGFVHKLPHQLVAAFRATLEEVAGADLLLVVTDAGDPGRRHQQQAVAEVLEQIGAGAIPRLTILNKIDLVAPDSPLRLRLDDAVPVSAVTGEGVAELRCTLRRRLSAGHVRVEFEVPYAESQLLGMVRAAGRIEQQEAAADGYRVSAVVPPRLAATLRAGSRSVRPDAQEHGLGARRSQADE